jgi:hypothetical protein
MALTGAAIFIILYILSAQQIRRGNDTGLFLLMAAGFGIAGIVLCYIGWRYYKRTNHLHKGNKWYAILPFSLVFQINNKYKNFRKVVMRLQRMTENISFK